MKKKVKESKLFRLLIYYEIDKVNVRTNNDYILRQNKILTGSGSVIGFIYYILNQPNIINGQTVIVSINIKVYFEPYF